ncbi:MAG: hypothetical protein IJB47_02460 [Oscillospiraceae bacterium]|nr:hypothetical protein [Oscillospiraceae bacterium]
MKQTAKLLICFLVCLVLLTGCEKGERFICKDLTLQLPVGYRDLSGESFAQDADFLLGRDRVIIQGIAEEKASLLELDDRWTLERYGQFVLQANGLSCSLKSSDGCYRFSYEASVNNAAYTYTGAVWEGEDHYWVVQIYCPSDVFESKQQEILDIMDSLVS